ncbi:MAG: hypothetical protein QM714_12535 [Nocardioides sp.]|uniref:hypothetical protein n=2 Tax=Nocardioides sp. TaxID=35761 RepID=UPI0039E6CB2C
MSWRGVFAGVLVLVALEAVLRTNASANRFGAMLSSVAGGIEWLMDPSVPAIPDLAGRGTPDLLSGLGGTGGQKGKGGSGGSGGFAGGEGGGAGGGGSW